MEELFSVETAAQKLGGISPLTVRKYLVQGRLRRQKVGTRTFIRESELIRFLEEQGTQPSMVGRRLQSERTQREAA